MTKTILYDSAEMISCEEYKEIGDSRSCRKCRFCNGTLNSGASFTNRSHAISEGLGNHNVFCLDECDKCNAKFSTLEQSLVSFLNVPLCVYGIKGKHKKGKQDIRGIRTPMFNVGNSGEMLLFKFNIPKSLDLVIKPENGSTINSFNIHSEPKWNKYIPTDIFRSLSKYIVAIAHNEHLPLLEKTISWINNGIGDVSNYNVIFINLEDVVTSPRVAYFLCRQDDLGDVKILGFLAIANVGFLFEIPFTEMGKLLSKDMRSKALLSLCDKIYSSTAFNNLDLSSTELQLKPIEFNFQPNGDLKQNQDYFIIDSQEKIKQILKDNNFIK